MAQQDCLNTDLSNGAIVHSPVAICSDLDTQRGKDDEDTNEEDEEVELAEEVGEDVLMMAGDGEEVGESTEQNEPEEVRIIQMCPQSNGVIHEENRGFKSLKENCGEGLGDKDNQKIDEETNEEEGESKEEQQSNDKHAMIKNLCDLMTVIDRTQQEQILDNSEDSRRVTEDEEDKHNVREGLETDIRVEKVSDEKGGGESLKEECVEEEEHGDEDNENIDVRQTNEESGECKGEEESNNRHTVVENTCDLKTELDGEKQKQLLDHSEDTEDEANKTDVSERPKTQIREDMIGHTDDVIEEQELRSCTDDADDNHEPTVAQELEEETQLSINETFKKGLQTEAGEATEIFEPPRTVVTSDTSETDKQLGDEDDVCQPSTDSDSCIPFDTAATVGVEDNQISQITNWKELTDEKDSSSKQQDEFVKSTAVDYTEKNILDEVGKEIMKDDTLASDDVLEVESEESLEEQPQLSVVCSEEQSQTQRANEETLSTVINLRFQEEELQSADSQMLRDEQSMTEEGDASDSVTESLCEEERGEDDNKKIEQEKKVEVETHIKLPDPVVQCVEEGFIDTQQDADMHKSGGGFEVEEAGTEEPSRPGIEDTIEEKHCATEEKTDIQDYSFPTQSDEGIHLIETMTEQLKEEAFTADNIEDLLAEMVMANEPVTVLDDVFDELEEAPISEQKPASGTAQSEDTVEAAWVEERHDFQIKETRPNKGNEETHKTSKEEIQMNEEPKDTNRDFQFSLTDRVKELKQAMEGEMLKVDPQQPKKEDWRAVRVPPYRRKDDNWIKKEADDVKDPEVKDWRKEIKPVRKDIWESEMGHNERSPEKKGLPKKEDWIKELKSVIKDESLPRKRDEQVKKKRVVLLEDGHSYFPQRNENKEEVKLISCEKTKSPSHPVQDSTESQDQAYEISLYVKVKNDEQGKNCMYILYKKAIRYNYSCRKTTWGVIEAYIIFTPL